MRCAKFGRLSWATPLESALILQSVDCEEPAKADDRSLRKGIFKKPKPHETDRCVIDPKVADKLPIEGELKKVTKHVATARSIRGIHWRSIYIRSLARGEAIVAEILADVAVDANEKPTLEFHTFACKADGHPKKITIAIVGWAFLPRRDSVG